MRRRRFAALLLALLLCALPVRAEEDLPGGGGLWPGGNSDPGGEDLPGGGILWPGDWEPPGPEPGEEDTEPEVDPSAWADGTVETSRELCAWMRSLGPEGGEIALGGTVTLTWEDSPYFDTILEAPAVIHTGAYGLVYDGKGIRVIGQEADMFQIEGEGVEVPVLTLRGDQFFGSDWNEILAYQEVTASGRDGQGGVAVRVTSDSEVRNNLEYYRTRGRIHAHGTGAVGLKLDIPALVNCLDIDVSGEGALAVDGPEGTAAFLCTLSAGEGGCAAGAGVNTDGSILSPEAEGPRIDCRVGIDPQIPLGARRRDIERIVGLYDLQRYRLTDGSYLDVDLIYDEDFAWWLDASVPGPVDIPVALPAFLQGLGLEGEGGLTFRAWVRDSALPILADMEQEDGVLTFYTSYEFLSSGSVWDPETRLWRSGDGGNTWTDATDWETVTWCVEDDSVELFRLDLEGLDRPIALALENSAGWGNVVTLTPGEEGVISPGTGGDRDGGDREEQPGGGGGEHAGGGSVGEETGPDIPADGPFDDQTPPVTEPRPDSRPETGEADTPPQRGSEHEDGALQRPEKPTPETGADPAPPMPEPEQAGSAVSEAASDEPPAAVPSAPGAEREVLSGTAPSAPVPEQAPVSEQPPLSSPETGAVPEPETPPADKTQAMPSRPPQGAGLALPVFVLCAAGGLTALFTCWKKRGGR